VRLRQKFSDLKGASDALNNLGAIYYQQGKLDKARRYYQEALKYREQINDERGMAGSYDNIGVLLYKSGMTKEALDMHFRALKIHQQIGAEDRICNSLQNIGLAYLSQGDFDYALANYHEALCLAQKNSDKPRSIQLMINIGSAFIKQKNITDARKYYLQSYDESRSIGYDYGLLHSLNNLADIDLEEGNYHDSINKYKKCIELARDTGHIVEVISATTGVGRACIPTRDYKQSLRYLTDAMHMAKKMGIKETICDIYMSLSDCYEKQDECKKSLVYYKKYIALREELINKETTKNIHEIKTRYEVDKKEKETEISRLKNIELKNALDALTLAKQQSDELLLNILPHDVAEELKAKGSVSARYIEQAAVLFIDVKDFTHLSENLLPQDLVSIIDIYFVLFDTIIADYPIEKIKTIGDAYLCVAGLPSSGIDSAYIGLAAALRIRDSICTLNRERAAQGLLCFEFRFGLHVGPVIAGVVGRKKFEYDIWGDTVNTAARMEQNSDAGRINISGDTYRHIKDRFECTYRGKVEAKNKGLLDMYFVEREFSN
jgi:adenylate cyclase